MHRYAHQVRLFPEGPCLPSRQCTSPPTEDTIVIFIIRSVLASHKTYDAFNNKHRPDEQRF